MILASFSQHCYLKNCVDLSKLDACAELRGFDALFPEQPDTLRSTNGPPPIVSEAEYDIR
jgi:hypothetical protein